MLLFPRPPAFGVLPLHRQLSSPCNLCGKGPSSITLFALEGTLVRGAMLCRRCSLRVKEPALKQTLTDATDESHKVGKLPPSVSASLWSGKVPHLRAYAQICVQTGFREGSGAYLRNAMPRYLQDRCLKVLSSVRV